MLQVAALAYNRDGHGAPPACRYMDLLAIFPLTNFLAAALLVTEVRAKGTGHYFGAMLTAACWVGALSVGLWQETAKDFRGWLPGYLAAQLASERNTRGYMHTGDFTRYLAGKTTEEIPFPRPEGLAEFLNDRTIRGFLPADVRIPLPVAMTEVEGGAAFVRDGFPPGMVTPPGTTAWGSYPGREGTVHGSVQEAGTSTTAKGLPYLQFQFAGNLGEPGLHFVLQDVRTGRQVDWQPARVAHEGWHGEDLRRPGTDLRLIASDARAEKWFAFTEPVEMGGWSHWAGWVLRRSVVVFWAGWGMAILALGQGLVRLRKKGSMQTFYTGA